jgi:4-amino-4-deoxy-L-arabinose transferase-like glycosyltransferase
MRARLLTRADVIGWTAAFCVASLLLVTTRFTSDDPDSSLYAGLSARLAQEPVSRWIAPEWWGLWARLGGTGLYRDHPVGGFLIPAALGRIGVPGEQAAYVAGLAAGIVALLLVAELTARIATPADGRAALILLQLMPVAFIFRVRANQEYALLACTAAVLIGLDRMHRSSWGAALAAAALSAALLIKGLFVAFPLMAAVLWIAVSPTQRTPARQRQSVALAVGILAVGVTALLYEALYRRVTGESFIVPYWTLQVAPFEIATPASNSSALLNHALFYASRLAWHPAPWTIAALALVLGAGRRIPQLWHSAHASLRRGIVFAALVAACSVVLLAPSERVAERYVFIATYAVGTTAAVFSYRQWPALAWLLDRANARVPALPALIWLSLVVLRLGVGPLLPRV